MTQGQLAWYRAMEADQQLSPIRNQQELETHLDRWSRDSNTTPIGYILSLEGADSLRLLTTWHLPMIKACVRLVQRTMASVATQWGTTNADRSPPQVENSFAKWTNWG